MVLKTITTELLLKTYPIEGTLIKKSLFSIIKLMIILFSASKEDRKRYKAMRRMGRSLSLLPSLGLQKISEKLPKKEAPHYKSETVLNAAANATYDASASISASTTSGGSTGDAESFIQGLAQFTTLSPNL